MFQPSSRQSSLPKPRDPRGKGDTMPGLHMGRVIRVNPKQGKQHATVDVMLDDQTVLLNVVYPQDAGPDRGTDDAPRPRSVVGVMYAWGSKMTPVVVAVYPRHDQAHAKDGEPGLFRRVFPNGLHLAVHDAGTLELGFPDGSSLVVGDTDAPAWSFAGQKRESAQGDPFKQPPLENHPKPAPYQLALTMADGSSMSFKGGSWTVKLAAAAKIQAAGSVSVEAGGEASVKASTVKVETSLLDASGALLVKLPGGSRPIARVGDPVIGAGPITGLGNVQVLG